jgi:hypothetical protein
VKAAGLLVAAALSMTARVSAGDAVVGLTLDGRPFDLHGGVAVLHQGLVFADAIDLVKCFDGLITLQRSGAATITIGANTGTFTPGLRRATINATDTALPAAPFTRNGELFVPLDAFVSNIADAGSQVRYSRAGHRADIRVDMRRQQ